MYFISKLLNLLEISSLPKGLRLKWKEKAFNLRDLRTCNRLKGAGLDPELIVDVGANIGQFALSATTIFPDATIYSYEPVPSAYADLKQLASRYPNINPKEAALGATPGRTTLHITNQSQSSSILPLHSNHLDAYPHIRQTEQVQIQVLTLEDELNVLPVSHKSLLKIDVQGFESEVLAGAGDAIKRFEWILLETGTTPMYQNEILFEGLFEYLKEKGFYFLAPIEIRFTSSGKPAQFDALFISCPKQF